MTNSVRAQEIAEEINHVIPPMGGTMRFFGDWFGRPDDNVHSVQRARAEDECLIVIFEGAETLTIWNADRVTITETAFEIASASRVFWQWYFYGRPIAPENLYYYDYVITGRKIQATSNVDWYLPEMNVSISEPAVKMYRSLNMT